MAPTGREVSYMFFVSDIKPPSPDEISKPSDAMKLHKAKIEKEIISWDRHIIKKAKCGDTVKTAFVTCYDANKRNLFLTRSKKEK